MSSTGTTISRSSSFARPASTTLQLRLGPTRKPAIRLGRTVGGGNPDPLDAGRGGRVGGAPPLLLRGPAPRGRHQPIESLETERQVGAPLARGHRVDLVDDHRLDAGEDLAGG